MAEDKESKLEKLKKEYEKVQKKYKLPSFDELDNEFEIRKLDPDLAVIKELRRHMTLRLQAFTDLVEPVLNPQPSSLHSIIETKIFEKQELEPYFNLYKKLWALVHEGLAAWLKSEEEEAGFVRKVIVEWPAMKKDILRFVSKLADGWKKHHEGEKAGDSYLG